MWHISKCKELASNVYIDLFVCFMLGIDYKKLSIDEISSKYEYLVLVCAKRNILCVSLFMLYILHNSCDWDVKARRIYVSTFIYACICNKIAFRILVLYCILYAYI